MMKIQVVSLLFLLALGLASTSPLLAADRLKAGEWEFTTTTPGLGTRTFKKCMTAADAASVNGDEKTGRAAAEQLQIKRTRQMQTPQPRRCKI